MAIYVDEAYLVKPLKLREQVQQFVFRILRFAPDGLQKIGMESRGWRGDMIQIVKDPSAIENPKDFRIQRPLSRVNEVMNCET